MGHAAVTRADTHRVGQTFARGGVGQAGVDAKPFQAWIDSWEMRGLDPVNDDNIAPLQLKASGSDFSYALRLDAERPLVLQGDGGYSRKSLREQASYYYSQPHYTATGILTIDDKPVDVTGMAWLDREWSSQPLASDQSGWDWLSLHFNAGDKLMLYRMRQTDGRHYGSGKWIAPDGTAELLASADITMTPLSLHRDRETEDSDDMAYRHSEDGAVDRMHAAQSEKLDGDELSLLGRPDQLCRQPYRAGLSGNDRLLSARTKRGISAMYHFTALVTLLAVLVYFYSSILVSRARGKFGVKLPAISGNPDFERVFRAQMNTLEWLPIFLPSLWLFAIYIGDGIAAGIGLVWVIGRILYVLGYARAVKDRGPGFAIQALATIALWVGAFGAIVWRLVQA